MRCSQNSLTYVPLVGEAGDRAGRVRPDTWQLQEHGWVRRYQAVVLLDHDAGRPVQVHHPPVAAQVAPGADRVRERRLGEGLHRREALQEALVERDRARHLDLLQHHLGDQDAPGVARAPPRQVAPVLVEPRDQGPAHRLGLAGVQLEPVRACRLLAHVREGTRAAPLDKTVSGKTWLSWKDRSRNFLLRGFSELHLSRS